MDIFKKGISAPFEIERFEKIGPKIGSELRSDAINAILIALLLISMYISFRFDLFYAYGSMAALIHDVLITLGIFSILNIDNFKGMFRPIDITKYPFNMNNNVTVLKCILSKKYT